MNKLAIRNSLRFSFALLFFFLYIPHFCFLMKKEVRVKTHEDIESLKKKYSLTYGFFFSFLYLLHNNRYYRNIFYHRIGPVGEAIISWWRPGDRYFIISKTTELGGGIILAHPYSTIINAERIGKNFSVLHLTTIGSLPPTENVGNGNETQRRGRRPIIGDNVALGAGVIVIGDVKIGNNVQVGAGSVVVKDLPDNCVAVGNPARIIKYL